MSAGTWLKEKTVGFRHGIVKRIAPKLYSLASIVESMNTSMLMATPRPMTLFLKDYMINTELVGVEIGIAKAQNALSILQELRIKKLFLVDPYVPYLENGQVVSYQEFYEEAMQKISGLKQVVFLHKTSEQALEDIDEPLDFVYIDGNHSYEYVKQDIENYFPKVTTGGVLGGHDYTPFNVEDVAKAVNEFVGKHNRRNFYAVFPDWWYVKL